VTPPPVTHDPRGFLQSLFNAAIAAVQPAVCLPPHIPPVSSGRAIVVGAGKAAAAMAAALEQRWSGALEGLVITADGYGVPCRRIEIIEAAHPLPDERGTTAAERILRLVDSAGAGDLVLCLLSGGASALMTLPAPGVTLADKRAVTAALLTRGAAIGDVNCVRKHLSAIKGGRLAAIAAPAKVVTLIVSDVVGDDPAVIASGPTVPDPTTCIDALAVLTKYNITMPPQILAALASGALETPKRLTAKTDTHIIARPLDALEAAAAFARQQGIAVLNLGDSWQGGARDAAARQADMIRAIVAGGGAVCPPCVVLSGGELVVAVTGHGCGGPSTEFVLSLAAALDGLENVWALAADTDGADGSAGAAGAFVAPDTLSRARIAGYEPHTFLQRNDSASFFEALGDLFQPGPTLTNVNDFRAILILPPGGHLPLGAHVVS
jgi:glycerate 2-kinase